MYNKQHIIYYTHNILEPETRQYNEHDLYRSAWSHSHIATPSHTPEYHYPGTYPSTIITQAHTRATSLPRHIPKHHHYPGTYPSTIITQAHTQAPSLPRHIPNLLQINNHLCFLVWRHSCKHRTFHHQLDTHTHTLDSNHLCVYTH